MAEIPNLTAGSGAVPKQQISIDLRPTLFIGVGGTGMEVLMRVRRRILNTLWGNPGSRTAVESLTEFPVAQFIQFDLDTGAVIDSGRAQSDDLQYDAVKFSDEERIVETFDIEKYSRDDDALEKYPHIKEWLSLTPKKIRELGIDPTKGAGQIRAISRLYFFDKYAKIRDKIRQKLKTLKSGLSHQQQLSKLGLTMGNSKFRIVVVGSVAGGTGSGAFLDMGLLASWLAKTEVGNADVELMLFLPTGFSGANKDRTEANGYAALMELESAMLGNKGYIGNWDAYDRPTLEREPYNEVYLIDSGNLAQQHTKDVSDIYHMVADALFEDFASGDFSRRKRSVAVNQAQHKNSKHDALVPKNRFGDMRLSYSRRFSAFGQAALDTRQEARRDERAHRWAAEMLKAFFGVGLSDVGANRATDKQRDDFMSTYMALREAPFSDFPEFSDKTIELKRSRGQFNDYRIVEDLLKDNHGALLAGVELRVNARIDEIRSGFARADWSAQVREAVKHLESDAVRDQDSTADKTEDRVVKRRREVLQQIHKMVRDQLYAYLDNKEFGGLEYVLSLVEQIKDRLEAPTSGLVATLKLNAERYLEIKEAVRARELERLLNNLDQTKGGFFGNGDKQAALVMDHLRVEIANGIKFHLRAKAAAEAAVLMQDVLNWLGVKVGADAQGQAIWDGLVGELQKGRNAVLQMLSQLHTADDILRQDLLKEHVTLINVATPEHDVPLPSVEDLREWADEAFEDLGGSKALFPQLDDLEQRKQILSKVKRMAEKKLAAVGPYSAGANMTDPLFEALEQMTSSSRTELFRKLLACSMPWIDANLSGDFTVRADQYKCLIGVAGAEEFKQRFGNELAACVPTVAGITGAQLSIVETGVMGRAVCYCELSGIPLTVLRGLEGWRTSYRKESEKSPTHIHIDSTQFTHPIAPTTDEIIRLAEDFKHYLLAVMLGILTRSTQRVVPAGQYQFAVARGDTRRIGNERSVRQNGLPIAYRLAIIDRVQEQINQAGPLQLVALAALSSYYQMAVYTPMLVSTDTGQQTTQVGFASSIAAEAAEDMRVRARRKGLPSDLGRSESQLLDVIRSWAMPIGDSDGDAYEWEVREPGDDGQPRLKYMMNADMLQPGKLESLIDTSQGVAPLMLSGVGTVPPPLVVVPPPLIECLYHLGINGQQHGPYGVQEIAQMLAGGQLTVPGTKVWRLGLVSWIDLNQLEELAAVVHASVSVPKLVQPMTAPPPLQ